MKAFSSVVVVWILFASLFQMGCPTSSEERVNQVMVDGKVITEEQVRKEEAKELDALELKMLQSKATYAQDEHSILEKGFESLIEQTLIDTEAENRGISKEELIGTEITQKVKEPSDEEVDAFYEANKNRITTDKEKVLPQIREYLKRNQEASIRKAFLAGLESKHNVVRNISPLRFDVDQPGEPSKGPATAPVVLVTFSDFQCPYCQAFSDTLKKVVEQYGDKVRLVFRQFPLTSIHPDAERAAEASLCAADQNRFWEMHDLFFDDDKDLKEEDILERAAQLEMDTDAFKTCLSEGTKGPKVQEDIRTGAVH